MRVHLPVLGSSEASSLASPPVTSTDARDPAVALLDRFARRVRYLRVSVTDRCNYRCTYCMPEELAPQLQFKRRAELLSFEELERLVGVFARLGVRKLRLTGGEPTVRADITGLVRRLAAVAGIEQVVMTSNGHLLGELAAPLAAAGLGGVNVSIDTLDPERFHAVTGRGDLARVIAGIAAARAAGLTLKLNAVALRGVNDRELVALCRFAWAHGAVPRFIEHMPMSDGQLYAADAELSAAAIRAALEAELGPLVAEEVDRQGRDAGPARYWSLAADPTRRVGIISAMTEHFCDDCNRLRLTATGDLHACLGHDDALSLRDLIRAGGTDDDVIAAIAAAVTGKRAGHVFERTGAGGPSKHMIGMGG
jgi:cyclic pyranopterin phosphate synthase